MRWSVLALLLSSQAHALVPLSPSTTQAVDSNFVQMAQELSRQDLTKGGVVNGTTTYKGYQNFNSSVVFNGSIQGNTNNSSWTIITPGLSVATTTLGSCSLSTVTLTLATSSQVMVIFTGSVLGDGTASYVKLSPVVDGAFPAGLDATYSARVLFARQGASGVESSGEFIYPVALASGTHSFCLSASVDSGSATLGSATAVRENRGKFGVYELR